MWKNSSLRCLLALAILSLRSLIYSQEIGSLGHPQNLKCVTHNLRKMICTWDVSSKGRHGQTDFCYTTNDLLSPVCFKTKEKRVEIPVPERSTLVTITTNSISGSFATKEFEIHRKTSVTFVPHTPRILSLTPDFSTSTYLKWSDNGSSFAYGLDAFWQIQILRKEAMEKVTQVTYYSKLTHEDIILSWNWTSDMPLECTSHYVKIRCYINVTQFIGHKDWSDWSPVAEVPGKDTEPSGSGVFPQDTVVAVGSDVTICCVHEEGQQIQRMTYARNIPMIHLSSRSSAIRVLNASASDTSGTNVVCILSEDEMDGTVLFVGYAPDIPQELSCETSNFLIIKCTWKPGRPSGLYGTRRTKYSFERISGKNVSCEVNEMNRERVCGFPVLADQKTYDFILGVSNPIGQTQSSLLVDLTQRVHPKTPEKLTVSGTSTSVHLRWFINGSFAEIRLLCQIEISSGHSERKLHNVSMAGGKFSTYAAQLNALHPYTKYQFRVRCSAADHFWRWSDWSRIEEHTTLEAPPARGPDIWRERSPSGKSLKVFWKPLSLSEANGKIVSHEVSCYLLETPLEYKEVTEPSNSTEIKLEKNDCVITVVAKNHAGSSPASRITRWELPSENVKTDRAVAMGNGIYISWNSYPNMTCGYIVKWCHSSGSEPCSVDWQKFPSNTTDAVIKSALFRPGVRYNFSLYGCKSSGYQLLKNITGYMKSCVTPKRAPNFTVEETSSDSILVKWEDIPIEDCQGFLEGYRLSFAKGEKDALKPRLSESGNPELKVKNITDLTKKSLKILDLQGKTSYQLDLQAYTAGGLSPPNSLYVVTKEDSVGLIIAILIPVAVVVLLGVLASIFCYRKREWIKETFYPEIPNPENSKALQFQKNICEGNKTLKTLEMNPCTPNSVEVVETQSAAPKIEDTEMVSPAADTTVPEDGSDSETENHVVVSYCPPIIEEEISDPPLDEAVGSSQVVYIDIQSMYQPQIKPEEEPEIDLVTTAGYKPQMQLPISALKIETRLPAEEELEKTAGYRPQANTNAWNMDTPDSPGSVESNNENASFGPCSINSRQFLLPQDDEDSPKPSNIVSFTHFNKPND
ncbi:LOW QUALITY PROTEIN: leukemia inhibitory factor receptor-like [Pterocles gutturalis]